MTGYFDSYKQHNAYYWKVREILYAGLVSPPVLGVVVLPSFSPEYLLGIEKKEGKHFLTYRVCKTNIWYAWDFADAKPAKGKPIAVDTKRVEVNQPLVDALALVFSKAIAQTKYPEPDDSHRSDGTTYTFVAYIEGVGTAGGETWSPKAGTRMDALVEMVTTLKALVDNPSEGYQVALLQQAQQVLEQFTRKE